MSVWDSVDLNLDGGDFVKLDKIGDSIAGTLTHVRMHDFGDGKGERPQLTIEDAEGNTRTLTAGPYQLRVLLGQKKPEIGDHVAIELIRLEPRTLGKAKIFTLEVTKGSKTTTAAGAPPF